MSIDMNFENVHLIGYGIMNSEGLQLIGCRINKTENLHLISCRIKNSDSEKPTDASKNEASKSAIEK